MMNLFFQLVLFVGVVGACACGARQMSGTNTQGQSGSSDDGEVPWQTALFPEQDLAKIQRNKLESHISLWLGGRVYSSSGEDVPIEVGGSLLPLALRGEDHRGKRWALIGVGSGIELAVALSTQPAQVDLYEPSAELLSNASGLSEMSGLLFAKGRPRHDHLRIITEAPEGSRPEHYDLIIHPSAMAVISRPYRLYTVERFETLRDLLAPGGQVVIHLQTYAIRPVTFKTLLRTFAAAFPHVTVMSPEDLSSDLLLIGSLEPSTVDVRVVRQMQTDRNVTRWFELAKIVRDTDFACRAALVDRAEVARFVGDGPVFTTSHPMSEDEVPLFPPRDPENLGNEDENEDLYDEWFEQTGLSEYEDYPGTFYFPDWPYGAPCPDLPSCRFLTGFGDGGAASSTFANLALSLLAHGRIEASRITIERAHDLHRVHRADILRAARVYTVLLEELSLEGIPLPENRQARQAIEAATTPEDSVERLRGVYTEPSMSQEDRRVVELHLGHAECQLSDDLGRHGHYRLEMFVEQEPEFVERHPIVLYLLARCHRTRYDYPLAVDAMVRYIDQITE